MAPAVSPRPPGPAFYCPCGEWAAQTAGLHKQRNKGSDADSGCIASLVCQGLVFRNKVFGLSFFFKFLISRLIFRQTPALSRPFRVLKRCNLLSKNAILMEISMTIPPFSIETGIVFCRQMRQASETLCRAGMGGGRLISRPGVWTRMCLKRACYGKFSQHSVASL